MAKTAATKKEESPEAIRKKLVLTGADIVAIGEEAELLVGGKNYNTALISQIEGIQAPYFRAISSLAFHRVLDETKVTGRIVRAVVDREALGERQITIDCDVIQADGGTRCASITGGYAALYLACRKLVDEGVIEKMPLTAAVSAVSVGIFEDEAVLDLNYAEDSHAIVDCNVVMTSKGEFIEVQGTGEGRPFTRNELDQLLALGEQGCSRLCEIQRSVLGE